MRDAFGGVFMIRLLLVFIFIYVGFTAVSLNYSKAFRVKNKVIDFVEQNEIIDLDEYFGTGIVTKDKSKLDKVLVDSEYNQVCINNNGAVTTPSGKNGYCYNGIVIIKDRETQVGTNHKIIYYKVSTYADWNLGVLNKILLLGGKPADSDSAATGIWEITGEAKVIVKN